MKVLWVTLNTLRQINFDNPMYNITDNKPTSQTVNKLWIIECKQVTEECLTIQQPGWIILALHVVVLSQEAIRKVQNIQWTHFWSILNFRNLKWAFTYIYCAYIVHFSFIKSIQDISGLLMRYADDISATSKRIAINVINFRKQH